MAGFMAENAPRRILGMNRDVAFWVLAVAAMIVVGIVLDLLWGNV